MKRKIIKNEINDVERAYYGSRNIDFYNIVIKGPMDGESSFKETHNLTLNKIEFSLRYPLWHCSNSKLYDSIMEESCRAPLWYDTNLEIDNLICNGVKCLRESNLIKINKSIFVSDEFCWKCKNVTMQDCNVTSSYPFFMCENVNITNLKMNAKYSFQYNKNLNIENSSLNTKDAFWHSKNVVVKNSTITGEYLGWYSDGITFINCTIKGTQPLCYAKNIKFINCNLFDGDFAFENSQIDGDIIVNNVSIKNPWKGNLSIKGDYNLIEDKYSKNNSTFKLMKK